MHFSEKVWRRNGNKQFELQTSDKWERGHSRSLIALLTPLRTKSPIFERSEIVKTPTYLPPVKIYS